jgi:hypothetical protein
MDMTIPTIILLLITLLPAIFILLDDTLWNRIKRKGKPTSEDNPPSDKIN